MSAEYENLNESDKESRTQYEIRFVIGLGTWKPEGSAMDRKELLKNYIKASMRRDDWCGMDEDRILETANRLLDGLEG